MRFAEHFARRKGPVISFEVFPPKTDKALESLLAVLPRLAALAPSYMTVTYGALGSTQARTVEIAALIRKSFGIETASHLTCVGASREEIDRVLDRIAQSGIENIVALRGDPPQGETEFKAPAGGFRHASELVEHLRRRGGFGVAVAGYPEKHIEAPSFEDDLRHLKTKVESGADIVITQLFYQNGDFFRFAERACAAGVRVPIVPGLLSIQSYSQILRITSLCGAKIPEALRERLERAGDDAGKVGEVGVLWTVEQCRGLLERGVAGIHFYVLNRAEPMERIMAALRASGHL
jgi:methylenetetrahydrofolate reductase (NADPH)